MKMSALVVNQEEMTLSAEAEIAKCRLRWVLPDRYKRKIELFDAGATRYFMAFSCHSVMLEASSNASKPIN